MFKEALAPFTLLPLVSLLLFFGLLCVILFWVYRPSSKKFYEQMAKKALEDPLANQRRKGEGPL
ncbi:MAG: cbb3-type cytochrome c oxidase subunit 3 [Oligoflexales bacterium]|nr:cbb3-type cytochrome c oxidase subunit 3 [Oligoflexales bacterium]